MGASYFVTGNGHRAIVFTDTAAEHFVVAGAGYSRTAADGAFAELDPEMEMAANEPYFEFVSKKHLGDWVKTDKTHYKTCADEECVHYNNLKISEADHQTTANANCVSKAICDVCGEYGEKAPDVHDTRDPETKYLINEGTHQLVYSCCEMPYGGAEPAEHDADTIDCPEGSAVLKQMCSVCGYEHTNLQVSIAAPENLVWDGAPKEAVVTSGIARSALPPVKYYTYTDDIRSEEAMAEGEFPTAAGKYAAVQEVAIGERIYRPEVVYAIPRKPLQEEMVTLSSELTGVTIIYDGKPKKLPEITVTDETIKLEKGKDYEVSFTQDGKSVETDLNALTNAGTITITVTGMGNYSGEVQKDFVIEKAEPTASQFKFTAPSDLNYDGSRKEAIVSVPNTVVGLENYVVEYCLSDAKADGNYTETVPIDAGEYLVRVSVKENQNYKEQVVSHADWKFEIAKADVSGVDAINKVYTDNTNRLQIIVTENDRFSGASFTGYTRVDTEKQDQLTADITYTYGENQTTDNVSVVQSYISGLPDGAETTVKYKLIPKDPNYIGETIEQSITVSRVKLVFTQNDKPVSVSTLLEDGNNVTYGNENYIMLDGLKAEGNQDMDKESSHFTVKYFSEDEEVTNRPLPVGSYEFRVYYSGELGEKTFTDVLVFGPGYLYVEKRTIKETDVSVTPVEGLVHNGQNQTLVTGNTAGGKLMYSLDNMKTWVENPEMKDPAAYWVYYKVEADNNHEGLPASVDRKVKAVILPKLEATYGTTLQMVEEGIPKNRGIWTFERPHEEKVGNVTKDGNTFQMSYTPNDQNDPTLTNQNVVIHVAPAHVELDVSLIKPRYHKYTGAEIKPSVSVKVLSDWAAEDKTFPATEYEKVYSSITHPGDTAVVRPGKARVTIESNGNYIFDNTEEELTEEYIIFRAGYVALADTAQAVPPELKTTYATGADMKQALGEKLGESFPESKRAYVKYLMMNENKSALYDEFYWPDGGYGTLSWDYIGDLSQEDTFVVYGMYLVTSNRLGTRAGEIFQMTETDDTTPGTNEFYVAEDGIKFRLKNYAALCFAAEVDPNAVYEIGTSAKNGTVAFSIGSDSTLFTSATAKAGEKITVKATPKTNYALTKVQYLYEEGDATKAVTVEQNFSGKYIFEMPDRDITIKATFARKTSDSKNPYSGDRSRIGLWTGILALSGAGIAALVVFWLRKRKK